MLAFVDENYFDSKTILILYLLTGLFLDLDSDDDMELSPLDQLNNNLHQLHQSVQFLCGTSVEAPKLNGNFLSHTFFKNKVLYISLVIRQVFPLPKRSKNLDPFYEMDLDFWNWILEG